MIRTGYDHFREAEQHLVYARESGDYPDNERIQLAYAQVHAMLALAAANGANRPAGKLDVRTMSDPPAQGELITDQMGDTPFTVADAEAAEEHAEANREVPEVEIYCGASISGNVLEYDCMLLDGHDGLHVDAEGREFSD